MTEPALLLASLAILLSLIGAGLYASALRADTAEQSHRTTMTSVFSLGMALAFFVSSILVFSWPDGAVNAMDCAPWVDLKEEL